MEKCMYSNITAMVNNTKALLNGANITLYFHDLFDSGILEPSEVSEKINMLKKKQVDAVHNKKIYTRKDGRFVTRIVDNGKEKQVAGKDEHELYEKLYNIYYGENNASLEDLYPKWLRYREDETETSKKTIKENGYLWNTYLKGNPITQIPLKQLKPNDFIRFFNQITKGRTMTRKRFNDLKSVINGILYYAIDQEIIEHNYLNDINYGAFKFKPAKNKVIAYTEEERLQIINHLSNDDLYSLGIKLSFYLALRIGELKALKWSDIIDNLIYVQRFMNDKNEIIDDVKGHTEEGIRYIPLTNGAKEIIAHIKRLNPDGEYLFIRDNRPLTTITFNRRLKKCCEELNIMYRSSHKLRFSTASLLFKKGIDMPEIQKILGHTTLSMTSHYLRSITPDEETIAKMNEVLG
jgi:integrase